MNIEKTEEVKNLPKQTRVICTECGWFGPLHMTLVPSYGMDTDEDCFCPQCGSTDIEEDKGYPRK